MSSTIYKPYRILAIAAALTAVLVGLVSFNPLHAGQKQPVVHIVEITEFQFVPKVRNVRVEGTIEWVNRDLAPHTATAKDESWDTDHLDQGESQPIVVTRAMAQDYFCRFHPMMVASLQLTIED